MSTTATSRAMAERESVGTAVLRHLVIALIAFLTLVDLFATQAILPTLAATYQVSPSAMATAVNASTFGMAAAGLAVAFLGHRINRRRGVLLSLVLLSVPTALLSLAPGLGSFAALRVMQGILMCAAFSLTLAHLGERCHAREAAGAFGAYVTGNVLSNLAGRLVSAGVAEHAGVAGNFLFFALLNLAGGLVVYFSFSRTPAIAMAAHQSLAGGGGEAMMAAWRAHLRNPALRAGFGIGFCILFAFIGTFTYVNFVLVLEPFALTPMQLGLVYLVFLPSMVTTPLAGAVARRIGARQIILHGLAVALVGLVLLLSQRLPVLLMGLSLVAAGTFAAQAAATGLVNRAAVADRAAASGMYLASYFSGGLVGTILLGRAYEAFGWTGCVAGIAIALLLAARLARRLREPAI